MKLFAGLLVLIGEGDKQRKEGRGVFSIRHLTKEEFARRWEASREKYYRLAYCYTKNEPDALEILSEATYRGYCSLHQIREPEYFDTWFCRIIIYEAYRFLKQKKRWVSYEEYGDGTEEQGFQTVEDSIDLYRCLDMVAPEMKTLLVLKYFEERSFKEIGEILSLPENTVKTRIYRELKRLRDKEELHGYRETGI